MRLLASVGDLLLGVLRPAVGVGVTVGTLIPDPMPLPFVLARRVPGTGAVDPQFLDQALVDVQCFAAVDRDAEDLAETCRAGLFIARRDQTVVPGVGSISSFAEVSAPALLVDDSVPHGVYRYQATYQLTVRPAL